MFGFIGSLLSSVVSGVLSPLFSYLNKKQDVGLQEYQAMTSAQRDEYLAYVTALNGANQWKTQNNQWWGAHLMIYLFGLPAALHWGAVFAVSTFPNYFHGWVPQALPTQFAGAEQTIALSFFILAPTMPVVTAAANMMNRR